MNACSSRDSGFTTIDLAIVVVTVALLVAVVWPRMRRGRVSSARISCISNLKQIGLAARAFAHDHNGNLPWAENISNGGTKELGAAAPAFRHFLAVSNELYNPRILACRADSTRKYTTNFAALSNRNLSYFVGLDANTTKPNDVLTGDRNLDLTNVALIGLQTLSRSNLSANIGWGGGIHRHQGNVALADGSAHQLSTPALRRQFSNHTRENINLIIP